VVHAKFIRGLHTMWLVRDVGVIVLLGFCAAIVIRVGLVWPVGRTPVSVAIASVYLVLLAISATGSSYLRSAIYCNCGRLFNKKENR
jgi:hypothetical protein